MNSSPRIIIAVIGGFILGLGVGVSVNQFERIESTERLPIGFHKIIERQFIRQFLESQQVDIEEVKDFRLSLHRPEKNKDWDHSYIRWEPDAAEIAGYIQLSAGMYVIYTKMGEGEAHGNISFGQHHLITSNGMLSRALKIDATDERLPKIREFLPGYRYSSESSNGGVRLSFIVDDAKAWIDGARDLMVPNRLSGKVTSADWKSWVQLNGSNYAIKVSEHPDVNVLDRHYRSNVTLQSDATNSKVYIHTWNPD